MSDAILTTRDAAFGYGRDVLAHVCLTVGRGERIAFVGPNGAGKSTLLRGLLGLLPARHGEVRLLGKAVGEHTRSEIARQIAYLPQDVAAPVGLLALDVVILGRAAHRTAGPVSWAFDTQSDVAAAEAALAEVGAQPLASRLFVELSGGERRLVLIAQAIAQARAAVVLDEPTAGLDPRAQVIVVDRLIEASKRRGLAALLVTHDLAVATRFATRLVVIAEGGILADGPPATVLDAGLLSRAFGIALAVERPAGAPHPVVFAKDEPC